MSCQGLKLCIDMLVMGKKTIGAIVQQNLDVWYVYNLETNVPCRCEPSPLLCCAQLGSDIQ